MLKNIILIGAFAFSFSALSGYTVINNSDQERVITIQEAYRPESKVKGNLDYPVPLNDKKEEITLPSKSFTNIDILPCDLMLLTLITIETKNNGKENTTTTNKMTSCIKPSTNKTDANSWGLLIENGDKNSFFDKYYKLFTLDPNRIENFLDENEVTPIN